MEDDRPTASIIVCTHNRRELLQRCLESLLADTSAVKRDLVIVNNASTDGTGEFLAAFVAQPAPFPVRAVFEPRLGLSNARNTGIRVTAGTFVVFTDDDVWVDLGWADAMVAPFETPEVGVVGGRVLPVWSRDAPLWARECVTSLIVPPDLGPESRTLGPPAFVVGASLALRRAALEPIGPNVFDPNLGVRGDAKLAYEEAALAMRLAETWTVQYRADAIVHHPARTEGIGPRRLRKWALQEGVSAARADTGAHEWRLSAPHRAARLFATMFLAAARRLRHRDAAPSAAAVHKQIESFHWTGRRLEYLLGMTHPRLVDRIVIGRGDRARGANRSATARAAIDQPDRATQTSS